MKKIGFAALIATFVGYCIYGLNRVPVLDEKIIAKWSQVENQYQRRADLIPSLVATVKGYAKHEQETLTQVTELRAKAVGLKLSPEQLNDSQVLKQFEATQGNLATALSRIMVLAESYPDLKADKNFVLLQAQLEGTENRIAVARMDYIEAVREYNTMVRTFPGMIWAKLRGAQSKANFLATSVDAVEAPAINL